MLRGPSFALSFRREPAKTSEKLGPASILEKKKYLPYLFYLANALHDSAVLVGGL
jgi:hypothetical protein